jgi:hypothetical protein
MNKKKEKKTGGMLITMVQKMTTVKPKPAIRTTKA